MFSIYIDPDAMGSGDYLDGAVNYLCAWVRSATPMSAGGEILAPGDMEARTRRSACSVFRWITRAGGRSRNRRLLGRKPPSTDTAS